MARSSKIERFRIITRDVPDIRLFQYPVSGQIADLISGRPDIRLAGYREPDIPDKLNIQVTSFCSNTGKLIRENEKKSEKREKTMIDRQINNCKIDKKNQI